MTVAQGRPTVWRLLRGLVRRQVMLICLVIFCADLVSGILSPTFSLYAQSLGASLAFIGTLSSIVGLTQLLTSIPIGLLSDQYGRKVVLALGMVGFALATTLFALSPDAAWLIPGRILMGLASVSTFTIGAAFMGDVVSAEERGLAFGLYATSMGLGFGTGPLIGAAVAVAAGVPGSYLAASVLALGGAAIAAVGLVVPSRPPASAPTPPGHAWVRIARAWRVIGSGMVDILHNPPLLAGSLCNLLMNTSFSGAITNFFPLYAAEQQAPPEAINAMFSVRAFGSAAARLPSGAVTSRTPSRRVMVIALLLAMAILFLLARTSALMALSLLLPIEGIAYGMFMPAGQTFAAEHSTAASRGQVFGAYNTAGSLGSAISPLLLGAVAEVWGVGAVFTLTAALLAVGLLLAGWLFRRPAGSAKERHRLEADG